MIDLNEQLRALYKSYVDTLSSLPKRPEGWLPHIVYVEEVCDDFEGFGMPCYTRYRLEEINQDGTCILYNEVANERIEAGLEEINIDWLDSVLNWYYECLVNEKEQ